MNLVPVGVPKAVPDETVLQEPEPDVTTVIVVNTPLETNVKVEEEVGESAGLKGLKLKTITKLGKLIHVRKVGDNLVKAIMIDNQSFQSRDGR